MTGSYIPRHHNDLPNSRRPSRIFRHPREYCASHKLSDQIGEPQKADAVLAYFTNTLGPYDVPKLDAYLYLGTRETCIVESTMPVSLIPMVAVLSLSTGRREKRKSSSRPLA